MATLFEYDVYFADADLPPLVVHRAETSQGPGVWLYTGSTDVRWYPAHAIARIERRVVQG